MSWILRWRVNPFESDNLYVPIIYSFRARFNIARSGAYPYYDLYHFFTYDLSYLDWLRDDLGTDKMWGSKSSSEQFQLRKFHCSCGIFPKKMLQKTVSFISFKATVSVGDNEMLAVEPLRWRLKQFSLSPTPKTCHQCKLSPTAFTNIDIAIIFRSSLTRIHQY